MPGSLTMGVTSACFVRAQQNAGTCGGLTPTLTIVDTLYAGVDLERGTLRRDLSRTVAITVTPSLCGDD